MTVSQTIDFGGNVLTTSGVAVGADTPGLAATSISITSGSGAPTFTATKGSLFIRTDGSSTATRLYVNTNGSTTWTNFTSAA